MVNYKVRVQELVETLREEQLKTELLVSRLSSHSIQGKDNEEIQTKYRLLKKKLILANIELLKLSDRK